MESLSHFNLGTNPDLAKRGLVIRNDKGVKTKVSRHTDQKIEKFWIHGYDWKYLCPGAKSVADAYSFVRRWPVWAIMQTDNIVTRIRSRWLGLVKRKYKKVQKFTSRVWDGKSTSNLIDKTREELLKKAAIDAKNAISRLYSMANAILTTSGHQEYVTDDISARVYPVHTLENLIHLAESKNSPHASSMPKPVVIKPETKPTEKAIKNMVKRKKKAPRRIKSTWEDALGFPLPRPLTTPGASTIAVDIAEDLREFELAGTIAMLAVSPVITYEWAKATKIQPPSVLRDILYRRLDRLSYNDEEIKRLTAMLEAGMLKSHEVSFTSAITAIYAEYPQCVAERLLAQVYKVYRLDR